MNIRRREGKPRGRNIKTMVDEKTFKRLLTQFKFIKDRSQTSAQAALEVTGGGEGQLAGKQVFS